MREFPVAAPSIYRLMPRLLEALASGPPVLLRGLRAVNFLSTMAEDMVVRLYYTTSILRLY
jgi:hypothetical protein